MRRARRLNGAAPAPSQEELDARDLEQRQGLYRSFSDGWQYSLEFALVPLILGLAGWWLDHRLGWTPVLTIAFVTYAVVGSFVRLWYGYVAKMRAAESGRPWARDKEEAKA